MVYGLSTVKAKVEFDHRRYDLGETIDATVTIEPTKNVTIREGRLELICDQNCTSGTALPHVVSSGGGRMGTYSSVSVGGEADTRNESYMQGSAILLRDAGL